MKNNDKTILSLKKQVEDKKKLLKGADRFVPKTNCSLSLDGLRYNLNVSGKEEVLLLLAKVNNLKTSLAQILPEETLVISGYPVDMWIDDLKSRFNTLNRKLEEERLKILEGKLHNLLTIDTKVSLELKDLAKEI
jgi:hypothetical protein